MVKCHGLVEGDEDIYHGFSSIHQFLLFQNIHLLHTLLSSSSSSIEIALFLDASMNIPGAFEEVEDPASPSLPFYRTNIRDVGDRAGSWRRQDERAGQREESRCVIHRCFVCGFPSSGY